MKITKYSYDAVVVGSGASGFNAINRLTEAHTLKVCMVTEGINLGTSRNTGSDKQTYYKLGLSGESLDSVFSMAQNLVAPGSVDGDNALCEAALSPRCFLNLCELGVPFPHNRYGEYIGYKTDHDPYERATSAGPLTSKFMTEALQRRAKLLNVEIYDNLYCIDILKNNNAVCGLLCLDTKKNEFVVFETPNIVLCTGGPSDIYLDSVYPTCHNGSTSLAINAGASLQNVTEWQYGLASTAPRWNVSGTYMQVLPRFVSIDDKGNEYEFLKDYFKDDYKALTNVFLKGYQWPFDSNKVLTGSSIIDLLVYIECTYKHRKVYLDYTKNPFGLKSIELNKLSEEACTYLTKATATQTTPIERLAHMNQPAIDLYKSKGVDITKEYLPIALCAQHHNGGIAVDKWWQTNIKGLFACGECAGTHGVSRPGGSALNAGQVGSLRASQYILNTKITHIDEKTFNSICDKYITKHNSFIENVLKNPNNIDQNILESTQRMSSFGAAIRNTKDMEETLKIVNEKLSTLNIGVGGISDIKKSYIYIDILTVQKIVLSALIDFSSHVGKTRGSALYYHPNGELREGLLETFRFIKDDGKSKDSIQEISLIDGKTNIVWRHVRPIPKEDNFFENVWRTYRENKNIY